MKKFAEQLKRQAEEYRLRANERHELRERLLAYMEYHPLPNGTPVTLRKTSRRPFAVALNGWVIGRLSGALALLFLVVVPTLAERSLPGEVLYPVKVRFNEELRGALVSTPYQKVEWETERLERRLAEARLLADAGRLTPSAEEEVTRAIKQHSDAAKQSIADIRVNDSEEAAIAGITLSSALEVQSEVLDHRGEDNGRDTSALATAVNQAKLDINPTETEVISYPKLLGRVEIETTRAYEYLNSLNGVASNEEKTDLSRRLSDVKTRVEGATSLKQTDEPAAAKQLADALGSTRKIISFMTNLDVRRNVKIDDLVPVMLTPDEKAIAIHSKILEAGDLTLEVETGIAKLATSSNDYLAIKDGLERYKASVETASSSLAVGDLDAAEGAVKNAINLARELRNTLTALNVNGVKVEGAATSTVSH